MLFLVPLKLCRENEFVAWYDVKREAPFPPALVVVHVFVFGYGFPGASDLDRCGGAGAFNALHRSTIFA